MSKVAIQGNASGTGTFTIAAPNSNTDRTLTLPDEAGTVLTSGGAIDVNASAPADSVAIDASGNVGIGTTTPSSQLDVHNGTDYLQVNLDADSIDVLSSGKTLNIGAVSNNVVRFFQNNTERMRIDSSGSLLVGTTDETPYGAPAAGFIVALNDGIKYAMNLGATVTADRTIIRFNNPNGGVGGINTNGSSTIYYTSSDYRLKENVVDLTGSIDRIKQLPVHKFNFIADPDKTVDGFLAHEVQDIVPEAVTGEKDAVDAEGNPDYQGIDQSKIVPLLTGALQEAIARIETLEAEVATLKGASA